MAQQRDCIIYKETVSLEHIKLVGKVYDQVWRVLSLDWNKQTYIAYFKIKNYINGLINASYTYEAFTCHIWQQLHI